MKRTTIIIIISLFTQVIFAQYLTPSVVSSGGQQIATNNIFYSYTVGEIALPISDEQYFLTSGFEQPTNISIRKIRQDSLLNEVEITAFPNPTQNKITLNVTSKEEIIDFKIIVFNILGERISLPIENNNFENFMNLKLDFEHQPNGQYFVKINIDQNFYTYKIIVNN